MTPAEELRAGAAAMRVDRYFRLYYRRSLDEYEILSRPGYWRRKEACGGRGDCTSAEFHAGMFCDGPVRHTATYYDEGRDPATGRWVSPFRTWRELREAAKADA